MTLFGVKCHNRELLSKLGKKFVVVIEIEIQRRRWPLSACLKDSAINTLRRHVDENIADELDPNEFPALGLAAIRLSRDKCPFGADSNDESIDTICIVPAAHESGEFVLFADGCQVFVNPSQA